MPWRHHDSDVLDPFPKDEYNVLHAEQLAECIIEPCQAPHEFLYMLGLSTYWKYSGYRGALRDQEGRGIAFVFFYYTYLPVVGFSFCRVSLLCLSLFSGVTMSNYLKKPSIRPHVTIEKGDKLREGKEVEMQLAKPLASNADVPPKTAELEKVEVPNPKVLNAKDKKKDQGGKSGKSAGVAGGSKPPTQKRGASDIGSLLRKRRKPDVDISVVDLDGSDDVHSPDPLNTIPPVDA